MDRALRRWRATGGHVGNTGYGFDFAQLIKQYAADPRTGQARYSPPVCTGARVRVDRGSPDPARISTSYVELSIAQEDGPAIKQTPAMAAGVADHIWTLSEIAGLLD